MRFADLKIGEGVLDVRRVDSREQTAPRRACGSRSRRFMNSAGQAAYFQGTNGAMYCLHLQLRSERMADGSWARLGHEAPVVFENFSYREGENRFCLEALNPVQISWEHASILLNQIRAWLRDKSHLRRAEEMQAVIDARGRWLPASG